MANRSVLSIPVCPAVLSIPGFAQTPSPGPAQELEPLTVKVLSYALSAKSSFLSVFLGPASLTLAYTESQLRRCRRKVSCAESGVRAKNQFRNSCMPRRNADIRSRC